MKAWRNKMNRLIGWFSFFALSIIFIYTPFLKGLFFDKEMYVLEIVVVILFILHTFLFFKKNHDVIHPGDFVVFLMPLSGVLSLLTAETPGGAWDHVLRFTAYATFFMLLMWLKRQDSTSRMEKALPYVYCLTGIWFSFFSVFGVWGWLEFKDLMLQGRLSGTFQYANTFATAICAFWLFTLLYLTKNKLSAWKIILLSVPLVSYGFSLLFSYSRGVMLLFPIAWILGLLILKTKEQLSFIIYSLISILGSFIYFRQVSNAIQQGDSPNSAALFFILTAAVMAIVLLYHVKIRKSLESKLHRFTSMKYSQLSLPLITVILGILLVVDLSYQGLVYQQLPKEIQNRLSDINTDTSSVVGRTTFYEDSLKIIKDAPITGIGGDGWKIVFTQYQEKPYLSNEVHSGYIELLVSYGWIGLVLFIIVAAFIIRGILRGIKETNDNDRYVEIVASLTGLAMLLMHSVIDFDFSFGTIWLMIIWLCVMALPNSQKGKVYTVGLKRACLIVVSLFVIVSGVFATRFLMAESRIVQASTERSIKEVQSHLEQAVSLNPYEIKYKIDLADIYANRFRKEQDENWKVLANGQIQQIVELEPNNPLALGSIASICLKLNDWEASLAYLEKARKLDRFSTQILDLLIQIKGQIAEQYVHEKQQEQAKKYAQSVLNDYKEYQTIIEPFRTEKIPDKRQTELDGNTYIKIGISQIIMGEYEQAIKTLGRVKQKELLLDAKALIVVTYEAMQKPNEASKIVKSLIQQYPDFPQRVITKRALIN